MSQTDTRSNNYRKVFPIVSFLAVVGGVVGRWYSYRAFDKLFATTVVFLSSGLSPYRYLSRTKRRGGGILGSLLVGNVGCDAILKVMLHSSLLS
jgi:hypothetical protein